MIGETLLRIDLPKPHSGQLAVIEQARRINWLAAGRRWRKTTLVMSILVKAALQGGTYIWGAPTFDQARVGYDETRKACFGTASFHVTRMTAEFPTGGRIVFRSLDNPDNARGWSADGIAVDEAGNVKGQAWYEILRPILMDSGGWAWIVGTPRGRNWFWREHIKAKDSDDSMAWQIPTLGVRIDPELGLVREPHPLENPNIKFSEIERMWQTMPERVFRQEVLAEFIESGGGVFRGIKAAATAKRQDGPIEGHQYLFGVDWGKSNDFTVITVLDITVNEICHIDRFNLIDYVFQVGRLKALHERFKPKTIIAEQNSIGVPIIEQLRRDGLYVQPFVTSNATKAVVIEALALAFEKGDLKIIPDETLIAELEAFEIDQTPTGMVKYSAPSGFHDDCVISAAIAWHSVKDAWLVW